MKTTAPNPIAILSLLLATACGGNAGDGGADSAVTDGGALPDAPGADDKRGEIQVLEGRGYYDDGSGPVEYTRATVQGMLYQGHQPRWHHVEQQAGACTLWRFTTAQCDPFCDGICVDTDVCEPWPTYVASGTLTITGLKIPVSLTPEQGVNWYVYPSAPPADLFDGGDEITATTSGGEMPALSATAHGVARLEAPLTGDGAITLEPGRDHTVTWTPADENARVRLTLNSNNWGHGNPYLAIIECDVADTAGQVTVPAAMVDAFPETMAWSVCAGSDCPPSTLTRYTLGAATVPDGHVDLIVGDQLSFGVNHQP